jgi:hypothetical protein
VSLFPSVEYTGYGRTERTATLTRTVVVEAVIKVEDGSLVDIAVRDTPASDKKPV